MNEQGLSGFGGVRRAVQGHRREVMALLQRHHRRRQMFAGVAAFLVALGHCQQVDYGEDAGGLGDSDAGGSEPEPPPEWTRGGSGSKRSCTAKVHNLSEKVVPLPFLEITEIFFSSPCSAFFSVQVLKIVAWFCWLLGAEEEEQDQREDEGT